MDVQKFLNIYNESRNGCNWFYKHMLVARFRFSDGVKALADQGCYWLVDIAATELPNVLRRTKQGLGTLTVTAKGGKALMKMTGCGDVHLWKKKIDYTDLPDCEIVFFVADEGSHFSMILGSEY